MKTKQKLRRNPIHPKPNFCKKHENFHFTISFATVFVVAAQSTTVERNKSNLESELHKRRLNRC